MGTQVNMQHIKIQYSFSVTIPFPCRNDILRELPEELSILLHCVYWKERDDVADMWYLLKQWPLISIERSLELLDYAYPDPAVRRFAIRCLHFLK